MKNETTSNGWKCTGGVNAGQDSYRTYENEITGERELIDGKEERAHLQYLSEKSDGQNKEKP